MTGNYWLNFKVEIVLVPSSTLSEIIRFVNTFKAIYLISLISELTSTRKSMYSCNHVFGQKFSCLVLLVF